MGLSHSQAFLYLFAIQQFPFARKWQFPYIIKFSFRFASVRRSPCRSCKQSNLIENRSPLYTQRAVIVFIEPPRNVMVAFKEPIIFGATVEKRK